MKYKLGGNCINKYVKDEVNVNIDESADWDVDSNICAKSGRGVNEGIDSDVDYEVRRSDNEIFEL